MRQTRTSQLPFIFLALSLVLFAGQPVLACGEQTATAQRANLPGETRTASSGMATTAISDPQASSAQPELHFERITTADGLSFPIVRDILQDQQGFLWFATDSGLNRYDGYTFTVYKEDPRDPTTMRFDSVSAIYEDSDGTLWVGGGGGLDRSDRETETFTHYSTEDGLPGDTVAVYQPGE